MAKPAFPSRLLNRLFAPRADAHAAVRPLWRRIVALARAPAWYARGGVEDSVSGRFGVVCLVLALVLLRMEQGGEMARPMALLTELFVNDMDGQLRESGVGDVVVGKQMGQLMGALGGRLGALRQGLADDDAALAAVLARNLSLAQTADPVVAVVMARGLAKALATCSDAALLAGDVVLPEVPV